MKTQTLLLVGGGAILLYLLMKQSTPAAVAPAAVTPGAVPCACGIANQVTCAISELSQIF